MGETGRNMEKVSAERATHGSMGELRLATGQHVALRLWEHRAHQEKKATVRPYETVGYVISGRAELNIEGHLLTLEPGDSWVVPAGSMHFYTIPESLTAIEAISPPAETP